MVGPTLKLARRRYLIVLNLSHSSLTPAQPLASVALEMKITLHQEGSMLTAAQTRALSEMDYAITDYYTDGSVVIWDRKTLTGYFVSRSGKVS